MDGLYNGKRSNGYCPMKKGRIKQVILLICCLQLFYLGVCGLLGGHFIKGPLTIIFALLMGIIYSDIDSVN